MDKTLCVVDNSPDKQGSFFDICGRKIKVEAPDIFERLSDYVILIIVSVQYQEKMPATGRNGASHFCKEEG